jgi:hypothetical protein
VVSETYTAYSAHTSTARIAKQVGFFIPGTFHNRVKSFAISLHLSPFSKYVLIKYEPKFVLDHITIVLLLSSIV